MTGRQLVVIGATEGPRAEALRGALAKLRLFEAKFIGYDVAAADPSILEDAITRGTLVRFDSPDRSPAQIAALYRAGSGAAEASGIHVLSNSEIETVATSRGLVGSPAQLVFGMKRIWERAKVIALGRDASILSGVDDTALSFDKTACSRHLQSKGLAVARVMGRVESFDELMEEMKKQRARRVFIKLRHGSSAVATTAFACGPRGQMAAYTTAVIDDRGRIAATRQLRRLHDRKQIAGIFERILPLGVHIEAWLPKASVDGHITDIRFITVDGKPMFEILRMSKNPITNLHLGGKRAPVLALKQRLRTGLWQDLLDSCRNVARALPTCFALGIDAAVLAGDRTHAIIEVNAFGDHVNGITYRGCTPQEWQVLEWRRCYDA